MEIKTEKLIMLEWRFSDRPEPVRTLHPLPLDADGPLLRDVMSDEFEMVTIKSERLFEVVTPEKSV